MANKYVSSANLERYDGKIKEYISKQGGSSYDDTELTNRVKELEDNALTKDGGYLNENAYLILSDSTTGIGTKIISTEIMVDDAGNNKTSCMTADMVDTPTIKALDVQTSNLYPYSGVTGEAIDVYGKLVTGHEVIGTKFTASDKFVGHLEGLADSAEVARSAGKLVLATAVGSNIKPVYFNAEGKPIACDYTIQSDVPSDAKFTDTVYDDTALKEEMTNAIAAAKTEAISTILGEGTSADFDTLKEIADWIESDTTGSAELVTRVTTLEDTALTKAGGTLNTGASLTAPGGTITTKTFYGDLVGNADSATYATSAGKLNISSAVGSTTKPVYFNANGVPTACTYTLGKSVPSDAVFTDTVYDDSGVIKLQGRNVTQAESDTVTGFGLNIKSSDGINSGITLQDETTSTNVTSIYPAEIRTPSAYANTIYADKIQAKTAGGTIDFMNSGGVQFNDIAAVSATIPWFDGNVTLDGSVQVNSDLIVNDNVDATSLKANEITINSSNLSGVLKITDGTLYTSLYADGLYLQDSEEGVETQVSPGFITSPKFNGYLNGVANSANYAAAAGNLELATAVGSSTKPVYFNASGVPVACNYTLGSACAKSAVTTVASGGTGLPTAGAVYTAIENATAPLTTYNYNGGYHSGSNTLGTDSSSYYGNIFNTHLGKFNVTSLYMNAFFGYDIEHTGSSYCVGAFTSSTAISSSTNMSLIVGQSHTLNHGVSNSIIAGSNNSMNTTMSNSFLFGSYLSCGMNAMAIGHYNSSIGGSTSGTGSYAFCIGNGTADTRGNAFMVTYAGTTHADGAYSTTGADYAEFVEWEDGNTTEEDRVAKFVTLHGDKLVIANAGDYIAGVVSAVPSVIGNNPLAWHEKYLKDEFGRYLTEEKTITHVNEETGETTEEVVIERLINPNYDPNAGYIMRDERTEWAPVGMLGFLRVYDDGTCLVDEYCKCADGGIATAATVEDNSFLTPIFRVVKRVSDNIIEIYFR